MSGLSYMTTDPPNAGVPTESQDGKPLGQDEMYMRNAFPLPESAPEGFEVVMPDQPTRFLNAADLKGFTQVETRFVLECAGNGRILMDPVPEGIAWDLGGASFISAAGVLLKDVLERLPDQVVELIFTGADRGVVAPEEEIPYQFSIDRELAASETPLLVTRIGDEPLTLAHGAPVRLVVPGHYAMKSVKWLTRIEGVTMPFRGHFVEKYRYYRDDLEPEAAPVGRIKVRSIIASPSNGSTLSAGTIEVRGSAWSGAAGVTGVEVSIDGGENWSQAEIASDASAHAATRWMLQTDIRPGPAVIVARATDAAGAIQPLRSRWNQGGYANNVAHRVTVRVV